jgi:hypothetical protein
VLHVVELGAAAAFERFSLERCTGSARSAGQKLLEVYFTGTVAIFYIFSGYFFQGALEGDFGVDLRGYHCVSKSSLNFFSKLKLREFINKTFFNESFFLPL